MFGFKSRSTTDDVPVTAKTDGKGRPTPTRRDAEAAAKQRAKLSRNPKARGRAAASQQRYSTREVREGMKRGDERFLLERDRGPVRRFIRDYVDHRVSFMEYLLPIMVAILVLQMAGLQRYSYPIWIATVFGVLLEFMILTFALGRELNRRFPDQSKRGWRFYAFFRAIYLRRFRMPKPQVRIGQKLPENYR